MIMQKLVFFVLVCDIMMGLSSISGVDAIRCYSCTVKSPPRRSNRTRRICSQFEETPHFEVDCPLSTLCQTRTFELHTRDDTIAVTTRGCAQQDYSYQRYDRGRKGWETITAIEEEAYPEGCQPAKSGSHRNLRRHQTKYCYCSQDLCNANANETEVEVTKDLPSPVVPYSYAAVASSKSGASQRKLSELPRIIIIILLLPLLSVGAFVRTSVIG